MTPHLSPATRGITSPLPARKMCFVLDDALVSGWGCWKRAPSFSSARSGRHLLVLRRTQCDEMEVEVEEEAIICPWTTTKPLWHHRRRLDTLRSEEVFNMTSKHLFLHMLLIFSVKCERFRLNFLHIATFKGANWWKYFIKSDRKYLLSFNINAWLLYNFCLSLIGVDVGNVFVFISIFFAVAVCVVKPEAATKKGLLKGLNTSKSGHTDAIVSPVGALWNVIKRCLLRQRRLWLETKSLVVDLKRRGFSRLL